MSGYLVGSECYATQPDALRAMVALRVPESVQVDGKTYLLIVRLTGDESSLAFFYKAVSPGASSFTSYVTPYVSPCTQLDSYDGLLLGWAVVGLWAVAWCFKALRMGLHSE